MPMYPPVGNEYSPLYSRAFKARVLWPSYAWTHTVTHRLLHIRESLCDSLIRMEYLIFLRLIIVIHYQRLIKHTIDCAVADQHASLPEVDFNPVRTSAISLTQTHYTIYNLQSQSVIPPGGIAHILSNILCFYFKHENT